MVVAVAFARGLLLALVLTTASGLAIHAGAAERRRAQQRRRDAKLEQAVAFKTACDAESTGSREASAGGDGKAKEAKTVGLAAPWMLPLKCALNHGGTQRGKRDRSEAKRKQLQLATVDPSTGRPSVRTVVFRGFVSARHTRASCAPNEESCLLTFITDTRSSKARHLRDASPGEGFVEVCWWLDEPGVQFRIQGRALLATNDSSDASLRELCQEVWDRLGASTRNTFAWPQPGAPRDAARSAAAGDVPLEDANFAVLVVVPDAVHELHLGGKQRAYKYSLLSEGRGADEESHQAGSRDTHGGPFGHVAGAGAWTTVEVNP